MRRGGGFAVRVRWAIGLGLACAAAFCLAACAGAPRNPVPLALESQATVIGMGSSPIRYWGDQLPPNADAMVKEKWAQVRATRPQMLAKGSRPVVNLLAISGGGSDGAFGAGVLNGWTASGKRPEFEIVTGVSTGALTAPFAFLGPRYDPALKAVFTTSTTSDIANAQPIRGLIGGDALSSNAPLARVIASYVTMDFMKEVAAEHRKGRRLLIGTTNLDAQRPVIWDMGQIATIGTPEALDLFRKVLLSSAAIPAVFPPGFIKVDADGSIYDEMHVDGGATREVFLLPTQFTAKSAAALTGVNPVRRIFIIRNGRVAPEWKEVKPRTLSIAGRAVSTLIKNQGIGDLYELYEFGKRNGADYNLAVIPGDFPDTSTSAFDPKYMTALFDLGFSMAERGYPWRKVPPRLGEVTHESSPHVPPASRPKPKPQPDPNISSAPGAGGGTEPAPQAASYY
jgi:Patatin-like phospholipase